MKKIYLFCLILAVGNLAISQDLYHHFPKLHKNQSETNVSILIQGDIPAIQQFVRANKGHFKYSHGDIAAVEIPAFLISRLKQQPFIRQVQQSEGIGMELSDTLVHNISVVDVHKGTLPLSQSYEGEDVIMAFLDTGIEFNHPDFQNSDSSTRILYIWDQLVNGGNAPSPYGYGTEWDSEDIDAGNCNHNPNGSNGHGTNVAGIGAGNGQALDKFGGVAPKADIIAVNVDLGQNFHSRVVDAINYVFKKADALEKPVVVNISLGNYFGSHDGKDLHAQMIDNMLAAKKGRSIVAAAGNAGHQKFHLGYPIGPDTSFTWFTYYSNIKYAYFQLWADTSEFNRARFEISGDNPNTYEQRVKSGFLNVVEDFNLDVANQAYYFDTLKNAHGKRIAVYELYLERIEDQYKLDFVISPDSTNYWWRLATTGEGRFDIWGHPTYTGTSGMVTNIPDAVAYPPIVNYKLPDNDQTMVGSWAASEKVITVANYNNRSGYIDYAGNYYNAGIAGVIANTSSKGPTRDKRLKPDIAAPGHSTLATGVFYYLNIWKNSQTGKVAQGGFHNRNGGTSMAAPAVAGIAALYLQQYPSADYREVKKALTLTAMEDNFTGTNLPDNTWGHGKANAFVAMTIEKGCTDPTALNYDPNALLDDGSCEYDSTTGILKLPDREALRLFPNPASSQVYFEYDITGRASGGHIAVLDVLGKTIADFPVQKQQGIITFDVSQMTGGIYFISLYLDKQMVTTKKLMVR